MRISWTLEEKKFVIDRVLKDGVHPYDVWLEYLEKFKIPRTYSAIYALLQHNYISYNGLKRQQDIKSMGEVKPIVESLTEEKMRQELSRRGYKVEKIKPTKTDGVVKIDTSMFKGEKIKFAVISCTHLGSKFQQLSHLKKFYQYASDSGCGFVLNCGDIIDGIDVYPGHVFELFLHGAKAQKDYTIEKYPKLENGGKTYIIDGNHDHSFVKKAGESPLEEIAERREDIIYCGTYGSYPKIKDLNVYIAHGSGGGAYARSYRLQKNIEQFSPDAKPDIYFLGHFHSTTALFQYRNVTAFMVPCFQAQTPYLRRKGLYPEIGGFIIEFVINDSTRRKGIAGMKFEWVPFYVPVDSDY